MKRKIYFWVLVVGVILLIGLGAVSAGGWSKTTNDLMIANQALLNESNYSQKLLESNRELRKQYNQLITRENSIISTNRALQAELDQSVIVGRVYADANYNQALDGKDYEVTGVPGFKVVLYRTERKDDGSFNHVEVASTTVTGGEYRFTVNPGEYFIGVTYNEIQLFNHQYNHIIHIDGGNMMVGRGETILGPTILLADNGLG